MLALHRLTWWIYRLESEPFEASSRELLWRTVACEGLWVAWLSAFLSEGYVDSLASSRGFRVVDTADFVSCAGSMSRADDRGCTATTRVPSAPRVTLNWLAEPFTSRGKEETKWIRGKKWEEGAADNFDGWRTSKVLEGTSALAENAS